MPNGKQFTRPPANGVKFTGSVRGEQGLAEWESFATAVKIRMSSTTVVNRNTGLYEWMIQHLFISPNMRVISGRGFETPVPVRSKYGPLHRVVLWKNGELCGRMNCRNPEQLNITYQKFEDDDLEYSDEIFIQPVSYTHLTLPTICSV